MSFRLKEFCLIAVGSELLSMWYEILPTFGIFSTFLIAPMFLPYVTNLLWLGKPYRRSGLKTEDLKFVMRDECITGDYYKHQGLDAIPDK